MRILIPGYHQNNKTIDKQNSERNNTRSVAAGQACSEGSAIDACVAYSKLFSIDFVDHVYEV